MWRISSFHIVCMCVYVCACVCARAQGTFRPDPVSELYSANFCMDAKVTMWNSNQDVRWHISTSSTARRSQDESCHTYEWVVSHVWMRHVTHMPYERVSSHTWMSHVTRMNKFCHTYDWVTSQVWMSHVARMNESGHTYEWVMSQVWMSHVTHMNESCHGYEWVMPHICMSHVPRMNKWHDTARSCVTWSST